ncbi:MAG TPA: DUF1214 domain-containing protein [Myxococcota bacterium]|nr:DUF1214 domain-containing protein [Myxococcota bacterium]
MTSSNAASYATVQVSRSEPRASGDHEGGPDVWSDFCRGLEAAGQEIFRPGAPKSASDLAEGHRYLTHALRSALELIVEGGDAAHPTLSVSLGGGAKLGWDNPDNLHHNAVLSGAHEYRLSGTRGDAHYFSLGVYAGSYAKGGGRVVAFTEIDDLAIARDGSFEVILSARQHAGNWIQLAPDTTSMMLRQIFWDRTREAPAALRLERTDAGGPPPPLDPAYLSSALQRVLGMIRGTNRIVFDFADRFRARPNTFRPGDRIANERLQGIPAQQIAAGWWELDPGQAAVIDFAPPKCRYWSCTLSNYWGQSLDYARHRTHLNARGAVARADGSVRIAVAHRNPGLADANWLDTAGHASGVWQFRWLAPESDVEIPQPRIVAV